MENRRKKLMLDLFSQAQSSTLMNKELVEWLEKNKFFEQVASTKYHGDYTGGLFDHSYQVTLKLLELTKNLDLKWERPESPYIVGLFHDLCKIDAYEVTVLKEGKQLFGSDDVLDEKLSIARNDEMMLKGHDDKSVMLLSQFINLTEEEILCIRYHMGAYETDNWNEYDRAIKKYETVLWTHTADMYASKVKNI